ncbi:MAG: PaaI family thioesterase [Acidimicrobiales bacterium]|nr:PaaI family thioesterase [Acidimicrobiales bacterium]
MPVDSMDGFIQDRKTAHDALGIELVEANLDKVVVKAPVTWKVHQPMGLLHGGVSALMAESAASIGASLNVLPEKVAVGIELNASHLRSITEGIVFATATPLRKGRSVHVWKVSVTDEFDKLICEARCTLAVIDNPTRNS